MRNKKKEEINIKLTQLSCHDKFKQNFVLRGRRSYADGGVFFIFKV